MKLTLFIDESGDFESDRGEWLISGTLFQGSLQDVNQTLNTKLSTMPAELGLKSIKDFHLTEFRRDFGHPAALEKAEIFINKISKLNLGFKAFAVINYAKHSLSEREKTYRAMLGDMIALVDSIIDDGDELESLDLVVATRTIDGELQTTIDDLRKDVINTLPQSLEYDLASLGLTSLIGKNLRLSQDYANNSWGLVCADFIANINYHRKKQTEKELLHNLEASGNFLAFEAFGNHAERRARIAERNHDYVLAIFRWVLILQSDSSQLENVIRLLNKLYLTSGSTGAKTNLESLIEKIYRHYTRSFDYENCLSSLKLLSDCIEQSDYESSRFKPQYILFRIRNLMMLLLNHQGETETSERLIYEQQSSLKDLVSNPENLSLILDFNLIELEFYINSLDFEMAATKANRYLLLINNYQEVWALFNDEQDEGTSGFQNANFWIKSQMAALRIFSLRAEIIDFDLELEAKFQDLFSKHLGSFDQSRLKNYYLLFLLKTEKISQALEFLALDQSKIGSSSVFDLFWILNVLNASMLKNQVIDKTITEAIILRLEDTKLLTSGHPNDIVWREAALFFWLQSDKPKALKFIKRAQNLFGLKRSPIADLLNDMNILYESLFKDRFNDVANKLNYLKLDSSQPKNPMECIRYAKSQSPY